MHARMNLFSMSSFVVLSATLLAAIPAFAITIDEFDGDLRLEAADITTPAMGSLANSSAIGGFRSMYVGKTSGPLRARIETFGGFLSHSQDSNVSANSAVTWDGDGDTASVNYSGLGGLDLLQDGATAFQLRFLSSDQPFEMEIRVYDSRDKSGGRYSVALQSFSSSIADKVISVPFSTLTAAGAGGPADLHTVGAIQLVLKGQTADLDVTLYSITTNGRCTQAPGKSEQVIDDCGVCGGKNAKKDACGVCGGDSSTCKDCAGAVNGLAKIDSCGICGGSGACLDCAGVPHGSAKVDCCGVCGGDGLSCPDKCTYYDGKALKKNTLRAIERLYASVSKYSNAEIACASSQAEVARSRIASAKKVVDESRASISTTYTDVIKVCDTVFCAKQSLASTKSTFEKSIKRLYTLSKRAQYAAGRACGSSSSRSGKSDAQTNFQRANKALGSVPQVVCK